MPSIRYAIFGVYFISNIRVTVDSLIYFKIVDLGDSIGNDSDILLERLNHAYIYQVVIPGGFSMDRGFLSASIAGRWMCLVEECAWRGRVPF